LIAREKGVSRSSTLGNIAIPPIGDETVAKPRLAIYNPDYTVQVVVIGDSVPETDIPPHRPRVWNRYGEKK
jgi:hypothetical protein